MQIPHEFAVAAFRLGHSLVRDDYVLRAGEERPLFAAAGQPETEGLVGDNSLQPGNVIDWRFFFDLGGETAQAVRPLDTLISDKLFSLPVAAIPPAPSQRQGHLDRTQPAAPQPACGRPNRLGLLTGRSAWRPAKRPRLRAATHSRPP